MSDCRLRQALADLLVNPQITADLTSASEIIIRLAFFTAARAEEARTSRANIQPTTLEIIDSARILHEFVEHSIRDSSVIDTYRQNLDNLVELYYKHRSS